MSAPRDTARHAADRDHLETVAFYDRHGEEYHRATAHVDLRALYDPFLRHLPARARVLDAGCGSGRDTKAFAERGYRVTPLDASATLARLATAWTGQPCLVLSFQEMVFRHEFDGIWACASLLHVPRRDMSDVMHRFGEALTPGGVLYVSLQHGRGEAVAEDGRFFNYYTADTFRTVIGGVRPFREIAFWLTRDRRARRRRGAWLNFLLKKAGAP